MLHRSARTFAGPRGEQRAEKVGHFFKAISGQDASRAWCDENGIDLTMRAASETTNVAGGYLAPADFDSEIISVLEAMGAFRQGAEIRPAGSDGQVRPRRTGGATATFVSEGAPIPESNLQLDAVGTAQKKLGILLRSSLELFKDSTADLGKFLTFEMGYAIATREDDCGFNGLGTSAFAGISGLASKLVGMKSSIAAGTGANTFLTLTATDMGNLMGGVLAAALPMSAWYTSATGYAQTFCRLAAVSGGLVATQRPDGTISASYLGRPVRFSAKLPDVSTSLTGSAMLFFGDLSKSSVIVERQPETVIAISHERAMDADQVLIRGVRRLDIVNHSCGDANTRGAVAMLVGTA
jgi:HK97 family phage major capsid protein